MENPEKRVFITRHSKKPRSGDVQAERYPGITKEGVALARERAKEILEFIEESPPESVIFVGGSSEMPRTKSTAEIYGDELRELLKNRTGEFLVITRGQLQERAHNKDRTKLIQEVADAIRANPGKKIIIDFPFFLKESAREKERALWFSDAFHPYFERLLEKNSGDEYEAVKDWIKTRGRFEDLQGPSPQEVAEGYERAIERLEEFARRFIGNRPLMIGIAGHSWDIDVFIAYLANNRKVEVDALEKVTGGKIIEEAELVKVDITPRETTVFYRGKKFVVGGTR